MTNTSFLPSIQGLRGVAAISVLIVHLYDMPLLAGFLPHVPGWFHGTINMGGHGVELFFMISGLLIPASLVRHASVAKFFYDRALRILPVFVVLHLVLFVAGPIVFYHPDLVPNLWTNSAEYDGRPNTDDDNNGYTDDHYGSFVRVKEPR